MDTTNQFIQKKLRLKVVDGFNFIHKDSIVRIELNERKVTVYTVNPKEDVSGSDTLKNIEKQLENGGFFLCHRSHIINIDHMVKYVSKNREIITERGTVPLAESRVKPFNDKYLK
jgi:two-component system, LytTR family, response regulator